MTVCKNCKLVPLTFSEQRLLTVTAGPVFYDAMGLNDARARFNYYPHDVWLYQQAGSVQGLAWQSVQDRGEQCPVGWTESRPCAIELPL